MVFCSSTAERRISRVARAISESAQRFPGQFRNLTCVCLGRETYMKIVAVVISVLALLSQWQAQAQGSSERVKVYISCSTIPEGGMNTYFTDIFTVELNRKLSSKGWLYMDQDPFPLRQAYDSFL